MIGVLGGIALSRARVQVPAWGRPWADVDLSEAVEFAAGSAQTLTIADASLAMSVVSGGVYEGRASYRLVAGPGWSKTIPRKAYANDAEVKASLVLSDAAAACGEKIADLPTHRLGPHFVRREGLASRVLERIAPKAWYVDFAGVAHIGARSAASYSSDAARTRVDERSGITELAVESVAGLVPGVRVDGRAPATDVEYLLEPKRLTARVWAGPSPTSRRVAALAGIIEAVTEHFRYAGVYEFRVVTQEGERLNLQPVRAASGFGDLARVPVRPGVAGCKATVQLGELVLVAFVDRDPARPVVVAHDAADAPGWMPLALQFGESPALNLARVTDPVQAGPFSGVITGPGSVRIKAGI